MIVSRPYHNSLMTINTHTTYQHYIMWYTGWAKTVMLRLIGIFNVG